MKYFHSFYLFCLRYCWLKWAPDFGRVQKTNTFIEQMNEKKKQQPFKYYSQNYEL